MACALSLSSVRVQGLSPRPVSGSSSESSPVMCERKFTWFLRSLGRCPRRLWSKIRHLLYILRQRHTELENCIFDIHQVIIEIFFMVLRRCYLSGRRVSFI